MSASLLADFSPRANRAEKPILFWTLAAANIAVIAAMVLVILMFASPYLQ